MKNVLEYLLQVHKVLKVLLPITIMNLKIIQEGEFKIVTINCMIM